MKTSFLLLIALLFVINGYAQSLDAGITAIANDLSQKCLKKNKVKLTLADFVNNDGKVDALTDYVRQELELKLINADNLQVMDRKHLKMLLQEHNLQSQGLIDESVVKSAIAFIKIDGLVLAEITYLGEQVKIKVTITDISTSLMYAASSSALISDIAIKNLLEPEAKICSECGGKGTIQLLSTCTACNGKGSSACSACGGSGRKDGAWKGTYINCEACNGRGKTLCNICSGTGKILSYETCPKCHGKVVQKYSNTQGDLPSIRKSKADICPNCAGKGRVMTDAVCLKCGGTGTVMGPATNWQSRPCSYCGGTGKEIARCSRCNGTGRI